MPLQKNLNVSPYYADYNPLSDYYKILYKAGYPIQARELTNSQLMLQNQIETFMSRFLKEGDTVVPGEFGYSNSSYVRLASITQGATAEEFVGYSVTGVTSGVKAFVNLATTETTEDDTTFYITYESSGTTAVQASFIEGETLESDTPNRYTAVVGVNGISKPITSSPLGKGSIFTVTEGYYFVDGTSVRCAEQRITLDKYGTNPTYSVGFLVIEEFITSAEDSALLDNSQGSTNFAAPGADRLKITLTLQKRGLDDDFANPNFILLAKVDNGNIQGRPDQTVKWAWLYDILAKRTFDESGDYIVTEFPVELLEYVNTDLVNGYYNADTNGLYPQPPGSGETALLTAQEAEGKFVIKMSPGAAYVQGFNVEYTNPAYLYGNKPRTQNFRTGANIQMTNGYNITIASLNGVPDFANTKGDIDTLGLETIRMYRNFNDGYVGQSSTDGRPFNIGKEPPVTYHCLFEKGATLGSITGYTVIYQGTNSCVLSEGSAAPVRGVTDIGGATPTHVAKVNPTPTGLLTPRYLLPNAVVENQLPAGTLGYNSTFDLGIISAEYFTELFLVDSNSTNFAVNWEVGDLVEGITTGSTGVVEAGSTPGRLLVSSVTGEFAPGEDIEQTNVTIDADTVGEKVSRIASEGEVYTFIFTDFGTTIDVNGNETPKDPPIKSLETETTITVTAIGATLTLNLATDYVYVAADNTLQPTAAGRQKLRNFPYPEGSTVAQRINLTLRTKNGVNGYASLVLGRIQNSVAKAKSLYAPQSGQGGNFTANIAIQSNNDSEIVPLAGNSLFSGQAGNNFITCDNFSGDPGDQLEVGDVVTFVDDTGTSISKLVTFATKPVGYGTDRDSAYIYFTTTLSSAISGKTVQRVRIKKKGNANETLIFPIPQSTVASLQSDPAATGINYTVMQEFIITVNGGTTDVPLTTSKQNETFVSNLAQTTIAVAEVEGVDTASLVGRQMSVNNVTLLDSGRQIVFTLDKTIPDRSTIKILIPVFVQNAKARTKTLNTEGYIKIEGDFAKNRTLSLGIADATVIKSVVSGGKEIKDNYLFDDGQRDNVYALARLILKPGAPVPNGDVEINYNYFTHSGEGDFFSVDSYTPDGGITYGDIPVYAPNKLTAPGTQGTSNIFLQLRDCLDFRPVVNSTGATPSYLPVVTPDKDATNSISFADSSAYDGNAVVPRFPVRGSLFICDLAYYMPRIDSLFMEYSGALKLISGVPSNNPIAPPDLATGLRLYDFVLPAYTFTVKSIGVNKYNYTRYKMSDIAAMDSRLQRMEELVTLSLLEQSALNMQVRDAVTGLNRFKNGIVVDRFANHVLGAVGTSQYRNSVDPQQTHLRAAHYTDQVELIEANQTPLTRKGSGYRKTGPLLTVDYESQRFMQNPFATRFINLQPFTVFTFDGSLVLTPSVDTFEDITTLPDLVIEDNNLFDAMVNLSDTMAESGIGTVWGDWENTGQPITSTSRDVIGMGGTAGVAANGAEVTAAADLLRALGIDVGVNDGAQSVFDSGRQPPLVMTTTVIEQLQRRHQTRTRIDVSTGSVQQTSYGERVVDVSLAKTCRSIPIRFSAGRLKPNTRYYFFFDEIDCSEWVSVDTIQTDFPDGVNRYSGSPGTSQLGFGTTILSDDLGNLDGVFLLPNGRPPVAGTIFTDLQSVGYQTEGPTRSFNTGTRKVRITSSETNATDLEIVEGFAETSFVSSGVLLDKQETILSTRIPDFGFSKAIVGSEDRWQETVERSAEYYDPVAQTFLIDKNNAEGLFVTELDVFFKTKDNVEGVEAYLTTTDGQVPTEQILPFSRVVKNSDTILRVIVNIPSGASFTSTTWVAGTEISGRDSGATGIVKSDVSFTAADAGTTVYNVVFNNYDGEFIPGERIGTTGISTMEVKENYTIASDTLEIEDVRLTSLGSGYHAPTIEFSAPQLPGGTTATATIKAGPGSTTDAGDVVYEVTVTNKGSGYTQVPSVSINDVTASELQTPGSGATAEVLVSDGTAGVSMGVCTSEDATAATKFKFQAPVYMLGNTNYSFVLKAPTSLNYNAYTSKMGENQLGTETRVTQQPNLGSLFKSQNGGLWTEDQTQDIKFVLYRAEFETALNAQVRLNNAPLAPKSLPLNPIETNADGLESSSDIFGNNPQVIKVTVAYHGLSPNDLVAISGVEGAPGGISNAAINTLHTVIDAGLEYFTVKVATAATNSERAGGLNGLLTPNKPYEAINVYTGAMTFASTSLTATNRGAQAAGVTGYNVLNQYRLDIPNEIKLMDTFYYNGAYQVANQINESKYRGANELRGNKSLETTVLMSTVNSKVSPVLDIERTNINLVHNLIDNPLEDASLSGARTAVLTLRTRTQDILLPTGSDFTYTNGGTTYTAKVKSYNKSTGQIKLAGDNLAMLRGATFSDSVVNSIGVDTVYTNGVLFEPETSPNGSVYAKWISRQFLFENPCDGIEMKLAVVTYEKTSIRAYYRPRAIGFEGDITQENWTPFNPDQELNVTDSAGQVSTTLYPGLPDNINDVQIRNSANVDPRGIPPFGYSSLTFTVQDISAFDAIEVKIVMTASNPAYAPLVDDMQLVCSE